MRVFELSKELDITNKEALELLSYTHHMTEMTLADEKTVREAFPDAVKSEAVVQAPVEEEEEEEDLFGDLPSDADIASWAASQHTDGSCMCCGFETIVDNPEALKTHLRTRHPTRLKMWFLNPDMGPDAYSKMMARKDGSVPEEWSGDLKDQAVDVFEVEEDNINPGFNHVPLAIQKNLERTGSHGRWVNPNNIRRYWDMGYRFVESPKGDAEDELRYRDGSHDSKMRTRELSYMAIDGERYEKYQRIKRARVEASEAALPASVERKRESLGDAGQTTYEHQLKVRGLTPENAMTLARNADRSGRPIIN